MRHVAFLRGMNVGGRRLTNDELCRHVGDLGFEDVRAFLAGGNVVFETRRTKDLAGRIERGLRAALGYDVPTILRTADEVRAIAAREVFGPDLLAGRGKEHVWLLADEPGASARRALLALSSESDLLELVGRELHWLPAGSVLASTLTPDRVARLTGPATARTTNTVRRLARRFFTG